LTGVSVQMNGRVGAGKGPPPLVVAAVILLAVLPVLTQQYVPLVDYPNHVARSYIFAHFSDVAAFRSTYDRSFAPIPNMAIDVVLGGLMLIVGVDAGSRIFLALIVLLYASSVLLLSKALWRRVTWLTLPAMFLVFSSPFLYGFVNYVMALALAQLTIAAWLIFRRGWSAWGLALCVVASLATYLAHLAGYAILGVACGAIAIETFWSERRVRRFLVDMAPVCAPLALWLLFRSQGGQLGVMRWASWKEKGIGLLPLIRSYNSAVDVLLICVVVAIAAYLVARRDQVRWSRPACFAAIMLLLAFAVSPVEAFSGSAVDQRFVPPALILLLIGFEFRSSGPAPRLLYSLGLAAALLRFGEIWAEWRQMNPKIEAAVQLADRLPHGALVYPVYVPPPGRDVEKRDRGYMHVLLYSLPSRQLFVPTLFAIRGQQPIVFAPTSNCPKCGRQMAPTIESVDRLSRAASVELRGYTHLWTHGSANAKLDSLTSACCDLLAADGRTSLWRIRPDFGASGTATRWQQRSSIRDSSRSSESALNWLPGTF
jgi:hypothetical protein